MLHFQFVYKRKFYHIVYNVQYSGVLDTSTQNSQRIEHLKEKLPDKVQWRIKDKRLNRQKLPRILTTIKL